MLKRLHLYKSSNGGTKNPQMAENIFCYFAIYN